jgi:hypothetical protein
MKFHFLYLLLAFIVTSSSCSSTHTSSRKWEVISSKDYADQVQIGQGSPVICPIQLQDDKFLFCLNNNFYIRYLQDDITAIVLDKTTGMMESKFPKVSGILKDMQEQDGTYYWWATSNNNAQEHLLYTWKPGESVNVIELSETIGIPSWTNEIVEIASFQTETLLFLSAGYLEVGNSTVEYTPYIVSSDEGDTNPISSYHPYVFSQNELFVVALTPIDRGFVMGGKIIEIVPS